MLVPHLRRTTLSMSGNLNMTRKIEVLHRLSTWSVINAGPLASIQNSDFHQHGCKCNNNIFSKRTNSSKRIIQKRYSSTWKNHHFEKRQTSTISNSFHKLCVPNSIKRNNSCRTFSYGTNGGNVEYLQHYKLFTISSIGASKICKFRGCMSANNTKQQTCHHFLTLSCHGYHTSSRKFSLTEGKWDSMRTRPPWRVLFFGTDLISLSTLKALHGNLNSSGNIVDHLEVVTVKTQGRKEVPVYKFATKAGLPIHEWPIKELDHSFKYDVGVLVSFGHLIPERIIQLFPYGIINMHPSLLPRWRGASPIFHTVLNGDTETGVSISDIRPKHFDVGPILMQRSIPVHLRITTGELTNQLADMGAEMVLECLQDLPNLERFEHEQEHRGITYAHKVHPIKGGYVNWREETPTDIDQHFRAVQGYGKLRLTSHLQDGQPVSFIEMVHPELTRDIPPLDIQYRWGNFHEADPGCIALHRKEKWLLVKCKDGIVGFTKVICQSHFTGSVFYYGKCNHKDSQLQFKSEDNQLNRYLHEEKIPVTV